ncbi:methyl-accepting chemotaxis protein [Salinicola halophilus]|uniref:methyl-accepting chemotaxis protein n=1 Tax=Salinicola halophilus TaxID=184065 RepID=UPI001EF91799|nr:methyl-accepting chemotaxis protein [Salinicola halophilus]
MNTSMEKKRRALSLQTKVMSLVLVPLLLVIVLLVGLNIVESLRESRHSIEQQRQLLLEDREAAVRNVVEVAVSAIRPMVSATDDAQPQARRRAMEMVRGMAFEGDNYVFVYGYDGTNLVQPRQRDLEGSDMRAVRDAEGHHVFEEMLKRAKAGGGIYAYSWPNPETGNVERKYSYVQGIDEWGWVVGAGVYVTSIDEAMSAVEAEQAGYLHRAVWKSLLIGGGITLLVALIAGVLVRRILLPIRQAGSAMRDIASGNGDLTRRLAVDRDDEIGELATQFNAFVARMQAALLEVRSTSRRVHHSASAIARGSDELSSRTEQAAANLQETSASMEQITTTVAHSADAAEQADRLVQSTTGVAREGAQAMSQVEKTMSEIRASSKQIEEIIGLIDSIAFQTNILALNASVEAARAGEQGRGFAVVANEVRTLAARSSEASKSIRQLIELSARHTHDGSELVGRAGETMRDILDSVTNVSSVIGEISAGAREQKVGISQVNTAVAEMDVMTQRNTQMVQESASAASDMQRQADSLRALIDAFELGGQDTSEPRAVESSRHAPVVMKRPEARHVPAESEWETF